MLRKLPFFPTVHAVSVGDVQIVLRPYQLLTWIAVCSKGPTTYNESVALIPAILDTGFNGGFAIRDEHLKQWGGMDARGFRLLGTERTERGAAEWRSANFWLHRNSSGMHIPNRRQPIRLELDKGIMVFPRPSQEEGQADARPLLPLLGMRALHHNRLCLSVDSRRMLASLFKPRLGYWAWGI
jgi:hypothetical protein